MRSGFSRLSLTYHHATVTYRATPICIPLPHFHAVCHSFASLGLANSVLDDYQTILNTHIRHPLWICWSLGYYESRPNGIVTRLTRSPDLSFSFSPHRRACSPPQASVGPFAVPSRTHDLALDISHHRGLLFFRRRSIPFSTMHTSPSKRSPSKVRIRVGLPGKADLTSPRLSIRPRGCPQRGARCKVRGCVGVPSFQFQIFT